MSPHGIPKGQFVHRISAGIAASCLVFLLTACATGPHALTHASLADSPEKRLPKVVVLVPPEIEVREISAGGVTEKFEEWSRTANDLAHKSLVKQVTNRNLFQLMELPQLPPDAMSALDEYTALYDVVAVNAFVVGRSRDPAWSHIRARPDYTLGPGLARLAELAGAESALFVIGQDYISSSGRQAMVFLGALMGVALPLGPTFMTAGLVDLRTGDLLWFDFDLTVGQRDLRKPADMDAIMETLFKNFPGAVPKAASR
jgi:hypothetical protein